LIVGPLQDALFGVVLVVNTAIGILQELRAKRTLDRLAILIEPRARAIRDGELTEVALEDIVINDVLQLGPGDQVPVDGVVFASAGLELDQALITGEAEPVVKVTGDDVLSGSFVVAGTGRITATRVGAGAYARQVEEQARRFSLVHSELQQGINQILRIMTWVMVPTGALLVVSQLLRSHQSLADALRSSVAGVSAMVPEGLVLLTSVAFAVGALRLARRNVLVQELAAIEGLARVDVLCIDKTGTLTEPKIALDTIEPIAEGSTVESIRELIAAIAASDPTPNATMRAMAASDGGPNWEVTDTVPFSSARKWSAVSFLDHGTWILGAPDVLAHDLPDTSAGRDAGARQVLLARATDPIIGTQGDSKFLPKSQSVALLVFSEVLRSDASTTIGYLREQGISVKVLSGDSPATVAAIAERAGVGVVGEPFDASGEGSEPDAMAKILESTNVLGRVRPEQKLAAIKGLQARGHVVAMVGDGINDVQALKQADLGIAMGSGSQSSRSVSRVVLLDDSFAAVPHILREGRRVIANIGRVANLFVTKTAYAAILAVVVGIGGIPFPFFPRHLTIVSTFTIGVPGFFLALGFLSPRASPGFTRRTLRFAVPAGAAAALSTLLSYATARATPTVSVAQSRTAALLALLIVGFWVLMIVSRPLSLPKVGLLAAMIGGVALLFAVSFTRRILSLALPPPSLALAVVGIATGSALALLAAESWIARRLPNRDDQVAGKVLSR